MMKNSSLQILKLQIENNNGDLQLMDHFNGSDDFLRITENYLNDIFKNVRRNINHLGDEKITSLSGPPFINENSRTLSGFFSSGVSGEENLNVKSNSTNEITYSVPEDENISRNLFYLISIPRNKNFGVMLIEKKGIYSILKEIESTFNQFFKSLGYEDYYIRITQMPLNSYINDFIDKGVLSEINFIKKSIPVDITNSYDENRIYDGNKEIKTIKLSGDNESLKRYVKELYQQNFDNSILIPFGDNSYDDVTFLIRYNGQSKTFYVKDKSKLRSDMKVILNIDGSNTIYQSYFETYYDIISTFIFPDSGFQREIA